VSQGEVFSTKHNNIAEEFGRVTKEFGSDLAHSYLLSKPRKSDNDPDFQLGMKENCRDFLKDRFTLRADDIDKRSAEVFSSRQKCL
jgi:hypothetical protein